MIKTYEELITIPEYYDRLEYLMLYSNVGDPTFGHDRYINQVFYNSYEWRKFRRDIIIRDHGCDMAHEKFPVTDGTKILIHHINPITLEDLEHRSSKLLDPNNVVSVAFATHQAIHFCSKEILLNKEPTVRTQNDTCPWR